MGWGEVGERRKRAETTKGNSKEKWEKEEEEKVEATGIGRKEK